MQSSIEELIEEVKTLFFDDRLRQAFSLLFKLDMIQAEGNYSEVMKTTLAQFMASELVATIRSDMVTLEKYFKAFNDISEWTLIKERESMRTWYKKEPGVSSMLVAGECIIESSIFNPLAIFAEIDLFKNWMPQMDAFIELHRISKFRRVLLYRFKMPVLFSCRDYVCSAVGNIDKARKAVVFTLNAIDREEYFGVHIPGPGKAVRVDMKLACVGFEYIDEKHCRFRLILQIDPKLRFVPSSIINFGTKLIIFEFLKILSKMSTNLDDVYKERIRANFMGIYSEARKRLTELLGHEIELPFLDD